MVSIEADAVISVSMVFSRQYGLPKRQGYDSQIAYTSGGRPVNAKQRATYLSSIGGVDPGAGGPDSSEM